MSEEESQTSLAAGEKEVKYCPFCGEEFSEFIALNKKDTCPVEGGCGKSFIIYKK